MMPEVVSGGVIIMLVYFAGAIQGNRVAVDAIREIISFIKLRGIGVLTEHLFGEDRFEFFSRMTGIRKEDIVADDIERVNVGMLDLATHLIAEVSGASTGTGMEIRYAMHKHFLGKVPARTLLLYCEDKKSHVSNMVKGMNPLRYPTVTVCSYKDATEAKKIVAEFLGI